MYGIEGVASFQSHRMVIRRVFSGRYLHERRRSILIKSIGELALAKRMSGDTPGGNQTFPDISGHFS
jgi:hypothetical protein